MRRRDLMIAMGFAATALPLVGRTAASAPGSSELVPGSDAETELLFVQNARSFKLSGETLRLMGITDSTLYFSDRPEHLVGHWETADFIANWDTGGGQSFAADPPNAALSFLSSKRAENMVVVLRNPRLEGADLVYDVDVLEDGFSTSGESVALFIDTLGRPLSPVSVAGVHRRHRRRRRRVLR